MQSLTLISFSLHRQLTISNTSCLDETIIHVDTILYLSLYYLINDLVHLSNSTINFFGAVVSAYTCGYELTNTMSIARAPIQSYELLDTMHFSLENTFLSCMRNMQRKIITLANRNKEVNLSNHMRISDLRALYNQANTVVQENE